MTITDIIDKYREFRIIGDSVISDNLCAFQSFFCSPMFLYR